MCFFNRIMSKRQIEEDISVNLPITILPIELLKEIFNNLLDGPTQVSFINVSKSLANTVIPSHLRKDRILYKLHEYEKKDGFWYTVAQKGYYNIMLWFSKHLKNSSSRFDEWMIRYAFNDEKEDYMNIVKLLIKEYEFNCWSNVIVYHDSKDRETPKSLQRCSNIIKCIYNCKSDGLDVDKFFSSTFYGNKELIDNLIRICKM